MSNRLFTLRYYIPIRAMYDQRFTLLTPIVSFFDVIPLCDSTVELNTFKTIAICKCLYTYRFYGIGNFNLGHGIAVPEREMIYALDTVKQNGLLNSKVLSKSIHINVNNAS